MLSPEVNGRSDTQITDGLFPRLGELMMAVAPEEGSPANGLTITSGVAPSVTKVVGACNRKVALLHCRYMVMPVFAQVFARVDSGIARRLRRA